MIPAPEHFDSLIDHLSGAGIEVSALREAIATYLEVNGDIEDNFYSDPVIDHQVYYYRNVLQEFLKAITEEWI